MDRWQWQRIAFQVICIMNFLAKLVKKIIVHKNTTKNCTTALEAFSLPVYLFASFISFFIKARMLLQFLRQAFIILYMFSLFSFVIINANNNFYLSINILVNNFFHWNVFLHTFTSMTQGSCRFLFEVK